ncbi:MAG: NTP transferase domain-containing protein [Actinomycetota bacterium]|nr:NTP transferase domain-containing protein [Actinomycetota bacterium]
MSVPAGLLLAAGGGRRYGRPKALVELAGALLVDRALGVLADGGCTPRVVVLGAAADEVISRADLSGSTVVRNAAWESGMASSLRAGLTALQDTDADAALVLLVDTPGIGAAAVRRVGAAAAPGAVAVATYAGRPGHPVLLGRDHWAEVIRTAHRDAGAREFLAAHPDLVRQIPCDDVADNADVDVPGDLPGWR